MKMGIKEIIRRVIVTALLLAINFFLSKLEISVMNGALIFRFTFFINMIYAVYFNVWWCVAFGIFSDVLPFFIAPPAYSFFPGYTISAVTSMLIYRYFLYQEDDIDLLQSINSKLCVNTAINIVLGAMWRYVLFGNNVYYYGASLFKNLILAPVEGIIFFGGYSLAKRIDHKLKELAIIHAKG